LQLTDNGRAMYEDLVPKALGYSLRLEAALSKEQRIALDEIFQRLHAAAEK
jgi:DNA-binding MarR family transcriptional regulator